MIALPPASGRIDQLAYVVRDLDAAMARYSSTFGVGPFFVRTMDGEPCEYRGGPATLDARLGYTHWGDVQLELIEPSGGGPSVFHDLPLADPQVFHHVCFYPTDFDAALGWFTDRDVAVALRRSVPGLIRAAIVDTVSTVGHFVELQEPTDTIRTFCERVRVAAEEYDGTRPVRPFAEVMPV